jgi:hypothetical protein
VNATPEAVAAEPDLPAALSGRFEAAVVDWSAVADRRGDVRAFRALVEELCGLGFDLALVADLDVDRVDSRLGARPGGPGRLFLCVEGGSTFEAGAGGVVALRRQAGVDVFLADLWRAASTRAACSWPALSSTFWRVRGPRGR